MTTNKECLIYMRTSTLTNVKGDSVKRQKSSIMNWVKSNGYTVRGEYWDVESGSKDTMERPKFMRMISDSERMGIKVLVFSDQSRLSRDIIVQESTYRLLSSRGYSLVSSENPDSFLDDTPTSNLIRQILGSVSEFDKNSTVSKLRVSRVRKRESNRDRGIVTRNRTGKCEGSKRILEIHPELESLISKLRKKGLVVPLLSVGACPQQNSPCQVLVFCKETAFSGTFPRVYSDGSRFSEEQHSRGRLPRV